MSETCTDRIKELERNSCRAADSSMGSCGHVTFAVARLLIDTTDAALFGSRHTLDFQDERGGQAHVELRLHVPRGLVRVIVPVVKAASGEWQTDVDRVIGYLGTPSLAVATSLKVPLPESMLWSALGARTSVIVDIAYGGAFYMIVSADEMGFSQSLKKQDLGALDKATMYLKRALKTSSELRVLLRGTRRDLAFVYGVIVTEEGAGEKMLGTAGAETGICFFGTSAEHPQQINRSPTGSGVQARVRLATAQGQRTVGESWTYHSCLTRECVDQGAFIGKVEGEEGKIASARGDIPSVIVEVSGRAHDIGMANIMVETGDEIGKGFVFA